MRRRTRSPASTSAARATLTRHAARAARRRSFRTSAIVARGRAFKITRPNSHDLLLTKFAFSRAQVELDVLLPKQRDADASSSAPMGLTLLQLTAWLSRKLAVQEPDEVVRRAFRAFDERAKGFVSLVRPRGRRRSASRRSCQGTRCNWPSSKSTTTVTAASATASSTT